MSASKKDGGTRGFWFTETGLASHPLDFNSSPFLHVLTHNLPTLLRKLNQGTIPTNYGGAYMASNIADQARANEHGQEVYCITCLQKTFKLSSGEVNKLITADPGTCPRCNGPGPLFWR